uniref:Small-subunit processome Utp21 domain-containing protein n=1 Tax=Gadus morhua TaxID=8049 RepID=A0A8C5B1B7_GADMO
MLAHEVTGSSLFSGFRALGLYSNHLPHVLRYHARHREFYVTTAVGNRFHTYNVKKLGIIAVSNALPGDISCLAADRMLVFAAVGRDVYAFARNKEIVHHYSHAHASDVHLLLVLGDTLVSADHDGLLVVWDVPTQEEYLRLTFDPATFDLSALAHPSTYLNKVLLGSSQVNFRYNYTRVCRFYKKQFSAQSPAVDVMGVGLSSGRILLHDIRADKTLMSFSQDWGPVTTLSFRTDGPPIMAAGGPGGHMAFWDLESRRLVTQLRHAHRSAVAGATFLPSQQLLLTNGADNALKVWVFEQEGGVARLLRSRQGHSAPPTTIRHHGNAGRDILSAGQDGTLQSFSSVHERFNKSLGHGSANKKMTKKKGLKFEEILLPPITCFSSESAREGDWDGVVALHRGEAAARTWNYQRCTMGKHRLAPPADRLDNARLSNVHTTAVDITSCGNFVLIGWSSGHLDVYNLQSGIHRGHYGNPTAHVGAVRGVCVDGLNQRVFSVGADCLLRAWRFKTRSHDDPAHPPKLDSAPSMLRLHRDSGMLALALDDLTLVVIDTETGRVVRKFLGHSGKINDLTFSPDGRWLISASMDCTIRTWDLPSGCMVDCFLCETAAVSVSLSPIGDFLSSAHVDSLGIYLWSNKSIYSLVSLRPLPADYQPVTGHGESCVTLGDEDEDQMASACWDSQEQLERHLVTMTSLPESRWRNLFNLDVVKRRNQPQQPPQRPAAAPYFLPTVSGLQPSFQTPEAPVNQVLSYYYHSWNIVTASYVAPLALLKSLGPSAVDLELRGLSPDLGSSPQPSSASQLLVAFLQMLEAMLEERRDFDLAQAYLALLLKLYLRPLSADPLAVATLQRLLGRLETIWAELRVSFDQSLCLLTYTKTALL